jgi:peptide/nickel transport system ATP-binding protein
VISSLTSSDAATEPPSGNPLVEIDELVVEYVTRDRVVRAVDGVSFSIRPGEIVGLAGESGCGKSTMANAVMQVLRSPAKLTGGRILYNGENLVGKSDEQLRKFRWRNVSMVFQSAMNALNPVMRVGDQFVDMMRAHERISKKDALARAADLVQVVGIDPQRLRAYPHELSGGMRQRVIIAMALALEPELIVMDEPTTALDVVVQREILQQIRDLQAERGFAVLFITHDLSLLLEIAHRVAIMYAGEIVEQAPAGRFLDGARHPYTLGLLQSFPPLHGPLERLTGIPGAPPDLASPPAGCRFHPRCPHCLVENAALFARQTNERPVLRETEPDHLVACHLVEEEDEG